VAAVGRLLLHSSSMSGPPVAKAKMDPMVCMKVLNPCSQGGCRTHIQMQVQRRPLNASAG
jgi:hypothetical protein